MSKLRNDGFTPGPWSIEPDPEFRHKHPYHDYRYITNEAKFDSFSENFGWILDKDDGEIVCNMRDGIHMVGNATLIAAAPELLAACQRALMAITGYVHQNEITIEAANALKAAIEKATGNHSPQ